VDPNITVFSRRTFMAQTLAPRVSFRGGLPSHRKLIVANGDTIEVPDTLSDGSSFQVAWTGFDPDNPPSFGVPRYRFKVGTYTSGISSDTIAYFNTPSNPKSLGLASGVYTMTVRAFDVANAVGDSAFIFVVNYDPDTWYVPRTGPVGHYLQRFQGGNVYDPPIEGTFVQGQVVPYRSTVWWEWDGSDSTAGEANCLSGWSLFLSGSHNAGQPYTTGFRHDLGPSRPDLLFKTNNPTVLGPAGFVDLILDSLDTGPNIQLFARSRDCAGRVDGTPAIFAFACNFSPTLISVSIDSLLAVNPETGRVEEHVRVSWDSSDYEDGKTTFARVRIDGSQNKDLSDGEQEYAIPVSVFQRLSPGACQGSVRVEVKDRAGQPQSNDPIEVRFPLPDPGCP
jgi:hypothetical protein